MFLKAALYWLTSNLLIDVGSLCNPKHMIMIMNNKHTFYFPHLVHGALFRVRWEHSGVSGGAFKSLIGAMWRYSSGNNITFYISGMPLLSGSTERVRPRHLPLLAIGCRLPSCCWLSRPQPSIAIAGRRHLPSCRTCRPSLVADRYSLPPAVAGTPGAAMTSPAAGGRPPLAWLV